MTGTVGRCDRGVCVATGCGNGIAEPGEGCDDGNAIGGDGCAADCRKLESCGDGTLDVGEGCDDGNANPADGCDACAVTTWRVVVAVGGQADATSIGLNYPEGIAVDSFGNLYIADAVANRVRRVDITGVVTIVAGTGTLGSAGDGGHATNAQLVRPWGVAVDGLGNVYIADRLNDRVRRVDPTGVIDTIAGTGVAGFSGDDGPAISAQLNEPTGVAVDGLGTVYIADTNNHRVRRIDLDGVITTIAGAGTAGLSGDSGPATSAQLNVPMGVAVAGDGSVYIADEANHRVRRVTGGIISTAAGTTFGYGGDGGPATSAQLANPHGVALDKLGNLYITDFGNARLRRVDPLGTITTVAGTGSWGYSGDGGPAEVAKLNGPKGAAIDVAGNVYIADQFNHRIRRIDGAGVITTVAGNGYVGYAGDHGPALTVRLEVPRGMVVDGVGNLYISDTSNHRVRRLDGSGVITTVAGVGVYGYSGDGGPATSAMIGYPQGLELDGSGSLFITCPDAPRIRRVNPSGTITTFAGSGTVGASGDNLPAINADMSSPSAVVPDGQGNYYLAEGANHRVRKIDGNGIITTVAGTGAPGFSGDNGPAIDAQLNWPTALALSDQGVLHIVDNHNHRIRTVDTNGTITTVAGNGIRGSVGDGGQATSARLDYPFDAKLDGNGNLYILTAAAIRRVNGAGIITTLAGNDAYGVRGDGGPAINAQFYAPRALALDATGNIYVADSYNLRVRRIDRSGTITAVAGAIDPEGVGPLATARLAEPRAIALVGSFTLFAGGSLGVVQALRATGLEVVAGRYPHDIATGSLARYRAQSFGPVFGVAYDPGLELIYLTDASSHQLHAVTMVDPTNKHTWTIAALANKAGIAGIADGPAETARFRDPAGLYFDAPTRQLYIADAGNHTIRALDLVQGIAPAAVRTIAGAPATRGFFGDDGPATAALLNGPTAVTRCPNGDVFVADTGNHRVRRIASTTGAISTVLGDGVAASSGEGSPAATFPVHAPLGLACDALGNVFVSSTTTVRLLSADANGIVDGTGAVQTIYGALPRDTFPASVTRCLSGVAVVDTMTVQVTDSCTGLLIELRRERL